MKKTLLDTILIFADENIFRLTCLESESCSFTLGFTKDITALLTLLSTTDIWEVIYKKVSSNWIFLECGFSCIWKDDLWTSHYKLVQYVIREGCTLTCLGAGEGVANMVDAAHIINNTYPDNNLGEFSNNSMTEACPVAIKEMLSKSHTIVSLGNCLWYGLSTCKGRLLMFLDQVSGSYANLRKNHCEFRVCAPQLWSVTPARL